MAGAKGKVILFGKTGGGKSTVANSLVTGGIEDVEFTIGHGFSGCTRQVQTSEGRGWTVTDTVGLGEGEVGRVSNEDAEKIILKFLKEARGKYSHVIYVKKSDLRFDVVDEKIWKSFKRIFEGGEGAFTILFTNGDTEWLDENWESLPQWVRELGRANVLITNIPPFVEDAPVRDKRNRAVRTVSIEKLERDLLHLFQSRGGIYFTPNICNLDDSALATESKSILAYLKDMFSSLCDPLIKTLGVVSSIATIISMFMSI